MSNARKLDATDRAILLHLSKDGRLSNVELAARVGLTPAPCLRRVKRLEEEGVITGYRARIDPAAAGRPFCVVMSVEITMTNRQTVERFEQAVAAFDEVTEVRRVFGVPDYIIRVDVADGNAYERFQTEKMTQLPGVHRIVSHQTMKLIKSFE
ncbi:MULTISPECIES: Lrp/AsnC family transcriptional regulator [unclassified Streptomyces]|uniref:Lrp/AsnC family transcriptional regulator n=1 Tax=unclassified Streptomyces TaxID=2593676 RepID=UPI00332987A0